MADAFKACAVSGCNGNAHYSASGSRGLCPMHYVRQKRHGSPTAGRAFAGEANRWLEGHADHTNESACLTWPFGAASNGYGYLRIGGVVHSAHAAICALAHGERPSPAHEAAHSCGNGHLGCVNPRHLRWATSQENKADTVRHGTIARGERHAHAVLTEDEVLEIRAAGVREAHSAIAARYPVSRRHVSSIVSRRSWAWLD